MKLRWCMLILTLLITGLGLLTSGAQATNYTWTLGSGGNWSDSANWTSEGGSHGVPNSGTDTARVDNSGANVTVSVNGNYQVNNLKIDAGDAVSVNNGNYLYLGGTSATPVLDVAGTLILNSSGSNTTLQAQYDSTITGGGYLYLGGSGGSANNYIQGAKITLDTNTTIQGQGYIKNSLINNGAIIATGSGLNLSNDGRAIINNGTMTAKDGSLIFHIPGSPALPTTALSRTTPVRIYCRLPPQRSPRP